MRSRASNGKKPPGLSWPEGSVRCRMDWDKAGTSDRLGLNVGTREAFTTPPRLVSRRICDHLHHFRNISADPERRWSLSFLTPICLVKLTIPLGFHQRRFEPCTARVPCSMVRWSRTRRAAYPWDGVLF